MTSYECGLIFSVYVVDDLSLDRHEIEDHEQANSLTKCFTEKSQLSGFAPSAKTSPLKGKACVK